jgi:ABC-type uncharacterized transport system ATPase subunit
VILINQGRIVFDGPTTELKSKSGLESSFHSLTGFSKV